MQSKATYDEIVQNLVAIVKDNDNSNCNSGKASQENRRLWLLPGSNKSYYDDYVGKDHPSKMQIFG